MPTPPTQPPDPLDRALDLAVTKCLRDAARLPAFPHVTRGGDWLTSEHARWTGGFFVGMLWLAAEVRGDPGLRATAQGWARRLAPRAPDRTTHDMGFLFEPSCVRGHRIAPDPELRSLAIAAARALASRFVPDGRYIPAWEPAEGAEYVGVAIVDTVMNLPLLAWAAAETGEARLHEIARATAATIRAQHLRADGSTFHVVGHDPRTGAVLRRGTHQGAHDNSCWTRGQAWTLYGFARWTAIDPSDEVKEAARRTADYFLGQLGDRLIPPWDFDPAAAAAGPVDSAAGAIAASGLLELGRRTGDERYAAAGERIARGLVATCVDFDAPERPGLLRHGTVDYPRRSGVDESLIYGDHYLMEALVKLRHPRLWGLLGCV